MGSSFLEETDEFRRSDNMLWSSRLVLYDAIKSREKVLSMSINGLKDRHVLFRSGAYTPGLETWTMI